MSIYPEIINMLCWAYVKYGKEFPWLAHTWNKRQHVHRTQQRERKFLQDTYSPSRSNAMFLEVVIIVFCPQLLFSTHKEFSSVKLIFRIWDPHRLKLWVKGRNCTACVRRFQVSRQRCTAFTRNIGVSFKVCKENQFLLVPVLSKLTIWATSGGYSW